MEYITFTYDINFNKLYMFIPNDWDLKIEGYFATLLEFIKPHDNKKQIRLICLQITLQTKKYINKTHIYNNYH